MTLGEKIKELRRDRKMTLEQVGDIVGVGKSTVRKWENGIIENMKRDKIEKLAYALGVTPEFFFEDFNYKATASFSASADPLPLPPDEKQLLGGYRKLDQADKGQVCDMVNFLLTKDKYKQENSSASA